MTEKEIDQKKEEPEVKKFSVPFSLEEKQENITITTNTPTKLSKEQIINKAINFHLQGNIQEAAKYYQYFINKGFKDQRVFSNYGLILRALGKLKEAELTTRKAITINPDFAEAHSNLGLIFSDLGKLKEAETSQRKAIELNPNFAIAHYQLGKIFNDLGKLKEAEASFKQAIKLKLGFAQAYDALSSVLEKLGRKKEAEESSKKILYLSKVKGSKSTDKRNKQNNLFNKPRPIEYPIFYRPGMGTENVAGFLRSMLMMLRPKRVLEIGAGYTTPFLLEGLINNERVFDDGNLSESYFKNYTYEGKLVIIDDQSLGELKKTEGMKDIIESNYTEFIEGRFEGKAKELYNKYGNFDFVWFDCGGPNEYISFIEEFWEYCSNYIFFHFTYWDGKPNMNHKIIYDHIKGNPAIIDIVEPHKKRQGSITMVKKENFKPKN